MDAVDAVLARMRADQGVASDDRRRRRRRPTRRSPRRRRAALAREHAAMRALATTFFASAPRTRWDGGGTRTLSAWLCARRDATRDGDAFPSAQRRRRARRRPGAVAREGGTVDGGDQATTTAAVGARRRRKARANASANERGAMDDARKNRVRARRFEVGGDGVNGETRGEGGAGVREGDAGTEFETLRDC